MIFLFNLTAKCKKKRDQLNSVKYSTRKKWCADICKAQFLLSLSLKFYFEKTTFQWSKVVSDAIFPTNWRYICIKKWSQIFVSGTEREEKAISPIKMAFSSLTVRALPVPEMKI